MSQAFVLSGKITLDPAAAVAGLDATTAALAETKAAVEGVGRAGSGSAGMAKLTQQASALEAAMGRGSMGGRGYQGAAGAVGNLTAQFNDIGVMMMAGQNPLQLAIQQGTQISQVIGPMGASGAAKALGTAFMGMLNPVSLLTMGTIGLGAALVQWLTAGADSGEDMEAQIKNLTGALDAYNRYTELAKKTTKELRDEFGDFGDEMRNLSRYPAEVSLGRALETLRTESSPLLGGLRDAVAVYKELEAATLRYDRIASGNGGATAEQILVAREALEIFRDEAEKAAASIGLVPEQVSAISSAFDAISGAGSMVEIRDRAAEALSVIQGFYPEGVKLPPKFAEAVVQLDAIVASSARGVASAKELAALNISGGIRAAADEARRLANELLAAVGAAQSLASQGQIALREAQLKLEFKDDPVKLAGELAALQFNGATNGASPSSPEGIAIAIEREKYLASVTDRTRADLELAEWQRNQRSAAGGGGTAKEGSALADLIDAQLQELAVLRETDPVQRELLKHREALAGATDTERQVVEELIATRLREQELQTTQDFFTGTLYDAFEGLILEGNSLNDVLDNIVLVLARAALQATLLGEGPLAGLFGTSGGGGLLTMLAGAIIPGKAGGGMITGPGSGTSDDVLIAASSGEFMMTAAATGRHRHLLEAMNAGATMPGFARGGAVGGATAGAQQTSAAPGNITIDLRGARGNAEIEALVAEGIRRGLAEYDRYALPLRMRQISADSRRIG